MGRSRQTAYSSKSREALPSRSNSAKLRESKNTPSGSSHATVLAPPGDAKGFVCSKRVAARLVAILLAIVSYRLITATVTDRRQRSIDGLSLPLR